MSATRAPDSAAPATSSVPATPPAPAPDAAHRARVARARALGAAVAYGRVARAVHASPHRLAQLVRAAPAVDEAARRASVWAALGAYFGAGRRVVLAPPAPPGGGA